MLANTLGVGVCRLVSLQGTDLPVGLSPDGGPNLGKLFGNR